MITTTHELARFALAHLHDGPLLCSILGMHSLHTSSFIRQLVGELLETDPDSFKLSAVDMVFHLKGFPPSFGKEEQDALAGCFNKQKAVLAEGWPSLRPQELRGMRTEYRQLLLNMTLAHPDKALSAPFYHANHASHL